MGYVDGFFLSRTTNQKRGTFFRSETQTGNVLLYSQNVIPCNKVDRNSREKHIFYL